MSDIANLVIAIDSTSAQKAFVDIDKLTDASDKLDKATDDLGKTSERTSSIIGRQNEQMTQKKKVTDDVTDAGQRYIKALQLEFDLLDKTRAQMERANAIAQSFSQSEVNKAAALGAAIEKFQAEERAASEFAKAQDAAARKADEFVASLKRQADTLHMSKQEMLAYQAAQLGVSQQAAPFIEKLGGAEQGMHKMNFATAGARRELIVLAHEASQGQWSRFGGSLMVLGERTDALGMLFSSTGLAIGAAAVALGAFAYLAIKGASEINEFNKQLLLTNNYAGLTRDSLHHMAEGLATSQTSAHSASQILSELAATGKYTGGEIEAVGKMAIKMSELTGQSADEVIKEFDGITKNVSAWAANANEKYHFMGALEYERIHQLQETGRAHEALMQVMGLMDKAMDTSGQKVGVLTQWWRGLKFIVTEVTSAAMNVGAGLSKTDAVAEEIDKLNRLREKQRNVKNSVMGSIGGTGLAEEITKQRQVVAAAIKAANDEEIEAGKKQRDGLIKGQAVAAQMELDTLIKANRSKEQIRADDARKIQMWADQVNAEYVNRGMAEKYSQAAIDKMIEDDAEKHKDKMTKIAGQDSRATELAGKIKAHQDEIDAEKRKDDELQKLDDLLRKYHQISDDEYYNNQQARALALEQVQVESYKRQLKEYQNFVAKTNVESAKRANDIAATEKKIAEAEATYADHARRIIIEKGLAQDKIIADSDDLMNKYISTLTKEADQLEANNIAKEQSKATVERLEIAMNDLAITTMQATIATEAEKGTNYAVLDSYQQMIDKLKEINFQKNRKATALDIADEDKRLKDQAKKAETAWESAYKTIGDGLYNAIGRGGGAGIKKLMEDIKSWAARLVLSPIINPIAAYGASLINPTAASAQGGGSSVFGSLGNMFSLGKSLWQGFSTGFSGIMGSLGDGISSLGTMFGSSSMQGFGMGLHGANSLTGSTALSMGESGASSGASVAAAMPWVAAVASAMMINNSLYKQGWNINQGLQDTAGSRLFNLGMPMNGLASWLGPVGLVKNSDALLQKLGMGSQLASLLTGSSVISALFGNKTPEITRRGISGTVTGNAFSGQTEVDWFSKGGWFSSDKSGRQTGTVATELSDMLGSTYKSITDATGTFAKAIGVNADYLQTRAQAINFDFGATDKDTQDNISKMFEKITNDVSKELVDMANKAGYNLDQLVKKGETTTDTLARVATEITGVNEAMTALGYKTYELNGAGVKAADAIVQLYGSLENMKSITSAYYDAYYSDAEKAAVVTKNLTGEFKTIGYTLPDSLAQLREWIEAAKALGTEAGDKTYVSLMQLTGAFAGLTEATTAMNTEAKKKADDLAAQRSDIILQTMEAQGLGQQALNLKRQTELALMDSETRALALKLDAALKEKAEREMATQQAQQSVQIMQLQGKTAEALALQRKLELAGMDPLLVDGQKRIYALQDEAKAVELANSKAQLTMQILQLQGKTTEAVALQRKQELAAMDAALRPLQERIYALQDEAKAAELAKSASQIQVEILKLEGKTAEATTLQRKLELDAMDESLRPLQRRLYLLQDEAAATEVLKQHRELEIQLLEALGKTEEATNMKRQDALSGLDAYSQGLQKQLWAVQDAKSKLQAAYAKESEAMQAVINKMQSFATAARAMQQTLMGSDTSPVNVADQYANAKADLPGTIAAARSGDQDALAKLQKFVELSQQSNSNFVDYVKDFATVQNVLDDSASDAERLVKQNQSQLDLMKSQVDGLLNVNNSVLTVSEAIKALQDAMAGGLDSVAGAMYGQYKVKNPAGSVSTSAAPTPDQLYGGLPGEGENQQKKARAILEEQSNVAKVRAYIDQMMQAALALGGSNNQYYMGLNDKYYSQTGFQQAARELGIFANPDLPTASQLPAFANGGDFAGGLRLVGENGPELEVTGPSRIFNASQTASMLRGGSNNADLIAEIKLLRTEVSNQRAEIRAIVSNTKDTFKTLDRWSNVGLPATETA